MQIILGAAPGYKSCYSSQQMIDSRLDRKLDTLLLFFCTFQIIIIQHHLVSEDATICTGGTGRGQIGHGSGGRRFPCLCW